MSAYVPYMPDWTQDKTSKELYLDAMKPAPLLVPDEDADLNSKESND